MLWVEPEPRDTLDDFMAKIAIPLTDHLSSSPVAQNIGKFLVDLTDTIEVIRLKAEDADELRWWEKGYMITVGFASEIIGDVESHWSTACYHHSRGFWTTLTEEEPQTRRDKLWRDWILTIAKLLRYVDTIAENCIEAADDYYDRLKVYWDVWSKSPELIGFNALYHAGVCYTWIEDTEYLLSEATLNWEGWQEVGREVGRCFYEVFYNHVDYDYPIIRIVYPIEFEEVWETHIHTN